MKKKLILDVDTGIDDAIAILLAVQSEELELIGITTGCGNVSLDAATMNTCKVLDLIEAPPIPVVQGSSSPLKRKPHFEHKVHGTDGIGGALQDVVSNREIAEGNAAVFMIEKIMENPGEVTLVCTGPLTNLALAIKQNPAIVDHVKEVIYMGGAINGIGNVTPVAEFNMFADPEAASIVLEAGIPKLTQVGLDVTKKALLREEHIKAIQNPTVHDFVSTSTATYRKAFYEQNGIWACAMHDPLAVGVLIDPTLVKRRACVVSVETTSTYCDGLTVWDRQGKWGKSENVHVCMEVDADRFLNLLVDILNRA
ncbi:nucleoside hydrolase [Terribacillus saccharophilus]|uniref:nucleoside hydrolase n=1 Tax=Terribacillus saccharophilus TaxID=361277 RepID=UPI003981B9D6